MYLNYSKMNIRIHNLKKKKKSGNFTFFASQKGFTFFINVNYKVVLY